MKNAHYLEGISDIPEHVRADNEIDLSHEIGGTEAIHDLNALPVSSMERQVTRAHTSDARSIVRSPSEMKDLANTNLFPQSGKWCLQQIIAECRRHK